MCYAMLKSPNKDETAVHGCHCPGDMAVRMRKVLGYRKIFQMFYQVTTHLLTQTFLSHDKTMYGTMP